MRMDSRSGWFGVWALGIVIVVGAGLLVCGQTETLSVTMEPYSYVYDKLVTPPTYMQRFLLRVDSSACEGFARGDSVLTVFQPAGGEAQFDRLDRLGVAPTDADKYRLLGRFEGIDERSGEGLVGFTFSLTAAEYAVTVDTNDSTVVAQVLFVPGPDGLLFDHIGTTVKVGRQPVRYE